MKLYLSYFYMIRFMPKDIVPISTAIWDPLWYHESLGNDHIYQNKNGVIIGLRVPELSPYKIHSESTCSKDCINNPDTCNFKIKYEEYLSSIDYYKLSQHLTDISSMAKEALQLTESPTLCLMVHEAPYNKCSERESLFKYFRAHNVEIEEWTK